MPDDQPRAAGRSAHRQDEGGAGLHVPRVGVRGAPGPRVRRGLQPPLRALAWARASTSRPRCASSWPSRCSASAAASGRGWWRTCGGRSSSARPPRELFEVLEACVVPGGAPTFHRGLGALMEVVGPAPPSAGSRLRPARAPARGERGEQRPPPPGAPARLPTRCPRSTGSPKAWIAMMTACTTLDHTVNQIRLRCAERVPGRPRAGRRRASRRLRGSS